MARSNDLNFKVSAALKNIIGRDLITDDFIAMFELVKNSYDAYATQVKIVFEDDKIIIQDNGKGMSYDDLKDKWLFVAYSAKKEGIEDKGLTRFRDYRQQIQPRRYYAGAKGVGRFSCDRLGSYLKLIAKQPGKHSQVEQLEVDWGKFELDAEDEFIDITVKHSRPNFIDYSISHGTVLEITKLNSTWARSKILHLKQSLEKLINPFHINNDNSKHKFDIFITAKNELKADELETNPRKQVNGQVKNFIFETLNVKTTQIICNIDKNGNDITTKLIDRGELIYEIKEKNTYEILQKNNVYEKLSDISFNLFYLNRIAKHNFTLQMGINSVRFGSVFVYRNGFRVYPYGEPGNDVFEIDVRKAQGHFRYLGTRDLLGRIEITDDKEWFKETSSRDGGLIKNEAYEKLVAFFENKCLKRLENYVVDIQWALEDKGEELDKIKTIEGKSKIIELIAALTDTEDLKLIEYNEDIVNILKEKVGENEENLFNNLLKIASETGDHKYVNEIERAYKKYLRETEARKHAEKELEDTLKENLFLKSLRSQSFEEIVSFMHQISISAGNVENYLNGVYKRIERGSNIEKKELKEIIELVTLENKKMMSIAKFATKANFKMYTETVTIDLVEYIEQYIFNVVTSIQSENFKIKIIETKPFKFETTIKPLEINIIIDNMVSNSKKALASNFEIRLTHLAEDEIEIIFSDDGEGIPKSNMDKIFKFGFTTTSGSGLGLFHVKKILDELKGTIQINPNKKKGAEFIITLNKKNYEKQNKS